MPTLEAHSPVTRRFIADSLALCLSLAAEQARSRALLRDLRGLGRCLPFVRGRVVMDVLERDGEATWVSIEGRARKCTQLHIGRLAADNTTASRSSSPSVPGHDGKGAHLGTITQMLGDW